MLYPRNLTLAALIVLVQNVSPFAVPLILRQQEVSSSSTVLWGSKMKHRAPAKIVQSTEYIQIEQPYADNAWKTMDVVKILQQGGVGVLPTDTGYGFVTPLTSQNDGNANKAGLERILRIKGLVNCKKPLSLLVADVRTIDEYCFGNKNTFKLFKKNLPGPYTFILPAKSSLPKQVIVDTKGNKHAWKRDTLGIRMPTDETLRYLQDDLLDGMPLLVTSVPHGDGEEEEFPGQRLVECLDANAKSWYDEVDFCVDAGPRPVDGSTIFDLSTGEPELLRQGLGDANLVF